jgi:hypothetical protein
MKKIANKYGGQFDEVQIEVVEMVEPRLEYLDEYDFENIEDSKNVNLEFLDGYDDVDDWWQVHDSLLDAYKAIKDEIGESNALIRAKTQIDSVYRNMESVLDPEQVARGIEEDGMEPTKENIANRIEDRMDTSNGVGAEIRKEVIDAFDLLREIEARWQEAHRRLTPIPKKFPAIRITDEMRRKIQKGGVPLFAKGGRVSKFKRGIKVHDDAIKAIEAGDPGTALEMLEELKRILGYDDEQIGKLLSDQFDRYPQPLEKWDPLSEIFDPEAPVGGYKHDYNKDKKARGGALEMAKGGKPKNVINAGALFKALGEKGRLDPEIMRHIQEAGLPPPENVTNINEWIPPDERGLDIQLTSEEVESWLGPDDLPTSGTERIPPTDEFQEWFRNFQEKLDKRLAADKQKVTEMKDAGLFELEPGTEAWSAHSGKKFRIDGLDFNKKTGEPMYWVTGPDGERHQMAAWGLLSKPPTPAEVRTNKEAFQASRFSPKWADRDEFDAVFDMLLDYTGKEEFGELQVVRDPNRPGMFAAFDVDNEDDLTGFIIDLNQPDVMDAIEEVEFNEWPPKPRKGYAKGGTTKKDRPAKDFLQKVFQSMFGATPFVGEEAALVGRDVGERVYDLGALPVAGLQTQWYGIDPDTGESVYAGPFSGDATPGMDAIPGIIDETIALPGFPGLMAGKEELIPEASEMAFQRMEENEDQILKQLGIDYPSGLVENALYTAGIMGGQVPVPATWLTRLKNLRKPIEEGAGWLTRLARTPEKVGSAGVEFLSPIIDPKVGNYLAGTAFGTGLMTGVEALSGTENEQLSGMAQQGDMNAARELAARAKQGDPEAKALVQELLGLFSEQQQMMEYASGPGGALSEAAWQNVESGQAYAKGGRVRKFVIWDPKEDKQVGKPYNNKKRARTRIDKLDNDYGAYRYRLRELLEDGSTKPAFAKGGKVAKIAARLNDREGWEREATGESLADALANLKNQLLADQEFESPEQLEEWIKANEFKPSYGPANPIPEYLKPVFAWIRPYYDSDAIPAGTVRAMEQTMEREAIEAGIPVEKAWSEFEYWLAQERPRQEHAKGGKISRRDVLKGLLGAGAAGVAGVKGAVKGDPEQMLKTLDESMPAMAKGVKAAPMESFRGYVAELTRSLAEKIKLEGEQSWGPNSGDFDPEMIDMHISDAEDYTKIADLIEQGKYNEAGELYDDLDTAARDYIFDILEPDDLDRFNRAMELGDGEWSTVENRNALGDMEENLDEIADLDPRAAKLRSEFQALKKELYDPDIEGTRADEIEEMLQDLDEQLGDIYAELEDQGYAKGGRIRRVRGDPAGAERLRQLGEAQRGDPERAMLRVQHTMGGGVLNPVVEHTGDLIHRMSHHAEYNTAYPDLVSDKVRKVLGYLEHGYGFEREMGENIEATARFHGRSKEEVLNDLNTRLSEYADKHRELPVYNRPQYWARKASVAVGEQDWDTARAALHKLKALLELDNDEFSELALTLVDEQGYAKGGKVTRRDVLKGIGAAIGTGVAGIKGAVKGDPETMMSTLKGAKAAAPVIARDLSRPFAKSILTPIEKQALEKALSRAYEARYLTNAEEVASMGLPDADAGMIRDNQYMMDRFEEVLALPDDVEVSDAQHMAIRDALDESLFDGGMEGKDEIFEILDSLDREVWTDPKMMDEWRTKTLEKYPDVEPDVREAFEDIAQDARIWEDRMEYPPDELASSYFSDSPKTEAMKKGKLLYEMLWPDRIKEYAKGGTTNAK